MSSAVLVKNKAGTSRRSVALILLVMSVASQPLTSASPKTVSSDQTVHPKIDLRALSEPLQDLTPAERKVVDNAVKLIKENRHLQALADLTRLEASNPKNSAIRVLRAYVLLELGNVTGALTDASVAESSGIPAAYKCWFLAQVAYLAGNAPLCRREIRHVSGNSSYGPDAAKLGHSLDNESR